MTPLTHAVFFLRDDDAVPRITQRVPVLLEAEPSMRAIVVDKTTGGLSHTAPHLTDDARTTVLRAPRDEPFFQSWTRVTVPEEDFVIQLHDDDDWRGSPRPGAMDTPVHATRLTTEGTPGPSPMNFLFAAVRGDLWTGFTEFINEFDMPDGTLDQPYCHLLASCWREEAWLTDYTYLYDASDWSDEGRARNKNERFSREMGWGGLPGVVTMPATARLNTLALHGFLQQRHPDLAAHWRALPTAPAFRIGPLTKAPLRVRAAVSSSRGMGHAWRRLQHALTALATISRADTDLIVALAETASAQSRSAVEPILESLGQRADLSIEGHLQVWSRWIR